MVGTESLNSQKWGPEQKNGGQRGGGGGGTKHIGFLKKKGGEKFGVKSLKKKRQNSRGRESGQVTLKDMS